MSDKYDAIIIGSGQGGKPLAIEFANKGKKTLLIEKKYLGGTCINWGCTPTKTMVASSTSLHQANHSFELGLNKIKHTIDLLSVIKRKNEIVESFRESTKKQIDGTNHLDLAFGTAKFLDENTLLIKKNDGRNVEVQGKLIFINTGGRPNVPNIEGVQAIPYLTSTTIMELQETPKHLIVIGGGYISLEFSQMFHRFGSLVTILERGSRWLKREDEDVAKAMGEIFDKEGIKILCGVKPLKVVKEKEQLHVHVERSGKEEIISGSHLLLAAGRLPNTEELDLKNAGVETDSRGFIKVDEKLRTSNPHIFAIGDVKGGPQFTHISYDDYRILKDNLLNGKSRSINERLVPYTIFTDPQLARVGMSETEAKEKNISYKCAKIPMTYSARAIETNESDGLMKALVHKKTGEILGCAVIAKEGGELMSMIEIAMVGKMHYEKLKDAIFAHPTYAEVLNTLFSKI